MALEDVDPRGSLTTLERAVRLLRTVGPDALRLDHHNSIKSFRASGHCPAPAPVRCIHIGPLCVGETACKVECLMYCPASSSSPPQPHS
jgi:hypothetical protein